jgi:hypothetical protein
VANNVVGRKRRVHVLMKVDDCHRQRTKVCHVSFVTYVRG